MIKWAFDATMLSHDDDLHRSDLATSTTTSAAKSPFVERVLAVDGARMGLAVLLLLCDRADDTTVNWCYKHRASALSDTSTALI